jgi:hypothetical protein
MSNNANIVLSLDEMLECLGEYADLESAKQLIALLEELKEYREIGKVSTCRNAVELCRAMIERGIEPDNIKEYIKFEDYVVQKGFTIKGLLKAGKKQIPYKPRKERLIMGVGRCKCGVEFLDKGTNFCGNCGQKLDWRGVK